MRRDAPLPVRWASCWAGVQYSAAAGGREISWPFSRTSRARSSAGPAGCRWSSGRGSWAGGSTNAGSSAASGTTQGETEVRNDLPRNGPSGRVSNDWMSRALQSLSSTTPKTCSRQSAAPTGSPSGDGVPTTKPTSASMSSRSLGPYRPGPRMPRGRRTGVPETTTVPDRPW